MKQFDIFRNPDPVFARRRPYLVVLQSDFLNTVETVVVAPLAPATRTKQIERLTPAIEISGTPHVLLVHEMAPVTRTRLKRAVGTMAAKRDEILAAVDLIFVGF